MKPIVLDNKQEREILEALKTAKFLDNGNARAVFRGNKTIAEIAGLDSDTFFVVKLAFGAGGLRQNMNEVKTFLEWNLYIPLAIIYAYGRYIELMEMVDPCDFYDLANSCDCSSKDEVQLYCEDYDVEDEFDCYWEAAQIIDALNSNCSNTNDNCQIGQNRDGRLVAYDYGYDANNYSCDEQTSAAVDFLTDTHYFDSYIDGLKHLLDVEIDVLERFVQGMLHDFCNSNEVDEVENYLTNC